MISISNVSASQARNYYYERDPLFGNNSSWLGKTAEALGIEQGSEVNKVDFTALLAGIDPRDGSIITPAAGNMERRSAIDLTLSAPKSFAILVEIANDQKLHEVYRNAVDSTLQYAEKNFAQVRRSVNGEKYREDSGNLLIAKFEHSTSRATGPDEAAPNLHTHALIFNMSERQEGSSPEKKSSWP